MGIQYDQSGDKTLVGKQPSAFEALRQQSICNRQPRFAQIDIDLDDEVQSPSFNMDVNSLPDDIRPDFSPETIADRYPDVFEHRLTFDQTGLIKARLKTSHIPLTCAWKPVGDLSELFDIPKKWKNKTSVVLYSIIIDALNAFRQATYVRYSRTKRKYNASIGMGFDTVKNSIDFLVDNECIINFIAKNATKTGMQSFFRATPKLDELCGHLLSPFGGISLRTDFPVLRCKIRRKLKKTTGRYIKGEKRIALLENCYAQVQDEVDGQNDFINDHDITFEPPAQTLARTDGPIINFVSWKGLRTVVNTLRTHQYRCFVKDKEISPDLMGGRWYGGFWQGLNKRDRAFIKIDGIKVGPEFDFTALHAQLCYRLVGAEMPNEPYFADCKSMELFNCADDKRDVCKLAFLIALNAMSTSGSIGALANKMLEIFPYEFGALDATSGRELKQARGVAELAAEDILNALMAHNPLIKELFGSDIGIRLQRVDSEIMTRFQQRCRDLEIVVLGVHDSFLARYDQNDIATETFEDELELTLRRLRETGLTSYGMTR